MANEKRLIDVDAFRDYWSKNYRHQYANDTFLFALANFPTVDAVEVKHGRWYEEDGETEWECHYRCSECFTRSYELTNYCHNCGADMR